ncbi:MAG: hypothetical protein ACFFCS_20555 [Candidatus Hodarchaeota archaeon]
MNEVDKNLITDSFEEICEKHFLNARLETLNRIRVNLVDKISEIDKKINELKKSYDTGKILSLNIP